MSVTAIVINFNAGDHLLGCVQSLLDNQLTRILVVDNASSDGSLDRLRGRYGNTPAVEVLANPSNLGYGPAVNAAARRVDSEFLLIINPDCQLDPGALAALRSPFAEGGEQASRVGLAGPRVSDGQGRFEGAACRRFPTARRAFMSLTGLARLSGRMPALAGVNHQGAECWTGQHEVDATSGACLLMRRAAWEEVQGFDERYTLHGEDLDLMKRLGDAGWRIVYVPEAHAVHSQGVSSASRPYWVHRQKHRSMTRYFDQYEAAHSGPLTRALVRGGIWLHWFLLWPLVWLRS